MFYKITLIFKHRPLILKREKNYISLEFYTVSSQDLRKNSFTITISFLLIIIFIYILFKFIIWLSNASIGEVRAVHFFYINLLFYGFVIFLITSIIYSLYITLSRIIFLKTIIRFTDRQILIHEQIFGFIYKVKSIDRNNLVSLQKEFNINKNRIIFATHNRSLLIKNRRKRILLASHLAPKAIEIIEKTYNNYYTKNFSSFYKETENLYLL